MPEYTKFIECYVHNGNIGVLVELSCESSFAPQTAEFIQLAKNLAVHVAAASPASIEQLLQQQFVKDPNVSVGQLLLDTSTCLQERIKVTRFVRWDTAQPNSPSSEPPRPPAVVVQLRGSK
jgi:elongation factor Ts